MKKAILARPALYNETVEYCHELAAEGKVMIIRPNHKLNSFESDVRRLEMSYWHGFRMTKEKMKKIKKFIGMK